MKLVVFDDQEIEDLANEISESYDNIDERKGYRLGYIIGIKDAREAKMPHAEDVKTDDATYNSFWCSIFPASSGLMGYKYAYKTGYKSGYAFYLKYVRKFFDGFLSDNNAENETAES